MAQWRTSQGWRMGVNSQVDAKQNHDGALLEEVYGILQKAGKI
jgi:hypothetical protein